MLRFFRASRSIQVGTPEVRARSPFSRGRALARSPIGRMRHPVYTKSRLSAAAESLLFGICIRKRYSISLKRPSGRRRLCAVQAFCHRQNLGAGRIHFARAFQSPKGGATNGSETQKKMRLVETSRIFFWYARRDSNPQPSEPESDALSN